MKLFTKYLLAMLPLAAMPALTSCDEEHEPADVFFTMNLDGEDIPMDSDGLWTGWDTPDNLVIGNMEFSHSYTLWEAGVFSWGGFVVSSQTDNAYYPADLVGHQFTSVTGRGDASERYLMAFWSAYDDAQATSFQGRSCRFSRTDGAEFTPQAISVTNATYSYYMMLHGDSFGNAPFAKGDWFRLVAHGVKKDGTESEVGFDLARCEGEDKSEWIVDDWKVFDLSALGNVIGIYFTMESSRSNEYGMLTPSYFAVGALTVKERIKL